MILRSINQRLFFVGLVPLAVLAMVLVFWNGFARLSEAEHELQESQSLTRQLLNAPAIDALQFGNQLVFEPIITDIINSSPSHVCIALIDRVEHVQLKAGQCSAPAKDADVSPVVATTDSLSDFSGGAHANTQLGYLRITMNDRFMLQKKRQVVVQLIISVLLILIVMIVVGRLLRSRLIHPIEQMDNAMQRLRQRDFTVHLPLNSDDEVGRLGTAINETVHTIANYTHELIRRRDEANRALHEADEANLARYGLVRSLTEELEGPLGQMQSELTALAMNNTDPAQKLRIKSLLATLQDTLANFDDLIAIATSSTRSSGSSPQLFRDFQSELTSTIQMLSMTVNLPNTIEFSPSILESIHSTFVDIDVMRAKKALEYVLRAMYRHCNRLGVHIHFNALHVSIDQLYVSLQLKGFYDLAAEPHANYFAQGLARPNHPPTLLRWTDRDCKIIDYLLHEVNMTATYTSSPTGTVMVLLEMHVRCSDGSPTTGASNDWAFGTRPIRTTIVSDDFALQRYTTRGDLMHHDLKLIPYSSFDANASSLQSADAVVIDIGDDLSSAFTLLDAIKSLSVSTGRMPRLIALCTAGILSDALESRLFDCGFHAILQRPFQHSRLTDMIHRLVTQKIPSTMGQ